MMQIFYFILFTSIININQAIAGDISGKVVNRKGKPAKGISIGVKNTATMIKTSKDGTFVLQNATEKDTLMVYATKNKVVYIPVNDNYAFDIIINENNLSVVSGDYKEILSFLNIAKVRTNPNLLTKEQIERSNANSISELLRGSVPGVQITTIDNAPVVIIRGASTITGDVEPLYIVDKVQYTRLEDVDSSVNIRDVESVEVIKDGSMYGVKGANGVIIIKTKTH